MVEMQLSRIVIRETSDQQTVYLRELGGRREFPIVIGFHEAAAIDRNVRESRMPRPMTHDLFARAIESLGGKVQKVVICDLKQNTFYAELFLERADGESVRVDARPSDSIALASQFDAPIFVAEHVLDQVVPQAEE